MKAANVKRKKVEELSQYGKPLRSPKEVAKKQMGIAFSELREKFGLFGLIPFFAKVLAEQRRLKKTLPEVIKQLQKLGPELANEFVLMASMFKVMAKKDGREEKPMNSSRGWLKKWPPTVYQLCTRLTI